MRVSRILLMNWIALDICMAAYCGGWLWTYRGAIYETWISVWRLWT